MPGSFISHRPNTFSFGKRRSEACLSEFLSKRQSDHSFRTLPNKSHLIDFCSNDYLGFSRSALLRDKIKKELARIGNYPEGSTGSRLITGNHPLFEELEDSIAKYHRAEAGLIFNSGYDANLGFFSSVPQYNDLVLFDESVHASIRDGIKLTRGKAVEFRHNDLEDLKQKLEGDYENIYIAVESVYSMDGDFAPLTELTEIARKRGINLVVDEAHATGLFGPKGEGRVAELGLEKDVFARIHTFSKAVGCQGAIVLGSQMLKQFLINFARPFIFSTAPSFHAFIAVKCAYDILSKQHRRILKISMLVNLFKQTFNPSEGMTLIQSDSPIQSVIIPGNKQALSVSQKLEEAGIYAKAILYPTVPRNTERIRLVIHSFNTEEEIRALCSVLCYRCQSVNHNH
ncbi:MAG TPA: 8-amino-7-oxononanoate synthase [Chitinophagales bacterium]|nr:8-amino-7-oxononanoate synthase [Chitinophagales bacterium]